MNSATRKKPFNQRINGANLSYHHGNSPSHSKNKHRTSLFSNGNPNSSSTDQTREVKSLLAEGRLIYDKATNLKHFETAALIFSKAISKSSSAQVYHLNHIYHLRGLCQFKLGQFSSAERDFQEAISLSDEKSKVEFYNSLGRCKIEQAVNERRERMRKDMEERMAVVLKGRTSKIKELAEGEAEGKGFLHKSNKNKNVGIIDRNDDDNDMNPRHSDNYSLLSPNTAISPSVQSIARTHQQIQQTFTNQLEEAIQCFEKSLQFSNNSDGEAFLNLGLIYQELRKNFKAIEMFSNAVKYLSVIVAQTGQMCMPEPVVTGNYQQQQSMVSSKFLSPNSSNNKNCNSFASGKISNSSNNKLQPPNNYPAGSSTSSNYLPSSTLIPSSQPTYSHSHNNPPLPPSQHISPHELLYQAYIERGICSRSIGELENSENDFLKALEIKREDTEGNFHLGINYFLEERLDSSLDRLSDAIELSIKKAEDNEALLMFVNGGSGNNTGNNPVSPYTPGEIDHNNINSSNVISMITPEPKFYNYKGLVLYTSGEYEACVFVFKDALKIYEQRQLVWEREECGGLKGNKSETSPLQQQRRQSPMPLTSANLAPKLTLSQLKEEISECWYNLGNAYLNMDNREADAIQAFKRASNVLKSSMKMNGNNERYWNSNSNNTSKQRYSSNPMFSSSMECAPNTELEIKILYSEGRAYEKINSVKCIEKFRLCLLKQIEQSGNNGKSGRTGRTDQKEGKLGDGVEMKRKNSNRNANTGHRNGSGATGTNSNSNSISNQIHPLETECINGIVTSPLYHPTLFHLGQCQIKYSLYEEAISSFTKIIESSDSESSTSYSMTNSSQADKCVYEERGKAYLKNEQYDKALKDFEMVVGMDESYADIYYFRGMSKIHLRNDNEKISGNGDINGNMSPNTQPDNKVKTSIFSRTIGGGEGFHDREKLDSNNEQSSTDELMSYDNRNATTYSGGRGGGGFRFSQQSQQQPSPSSLPPALTEDFFKALELGSKNIGIFNGISCAYLQAGKFQKALIYSNLCLTNYSDNEDFLIQRSLIYLALKEYTKSIEDLSTALKKSQIEYSKQRREEEEEEEEMEKEKEKEKVEVEVKVEDVDDEGSFGENEKESQNYEKVNENGESSIPEVTVPKTAPISTSSSSIPSANPIIYYRRGLAYYKSKEYAKAIKDLEQSLLNRPNNNILPDIHYHIGIAYSNLEQCGEAIEPLTKAIEYDEAAAVAETSTCPTTGIPGAKPKYFHERAKCHILCDNPLAALNDLNEVISKQPNNAFAYFRRGFANKALKLYDEAAEDFLKARELQPDDPRLIINKKQIYQTRYRKLCDAGEEM